MHSSTVHARPRGGTASARKHARRREKMTGDRNFSGESMLAVVLDAGRKGKQPSSPGTSGRDARRPFGIITVCKWELWEHDG